MTLPKLNNKAKRNGSHAETVAAQRLRADTGLHLFYQHITEKPLEPQAFIVIGNYCRRGRRDREITPSFCVHRWFL